MLAEEASSDAGGQDDDPLYRYRLPSRLPISYSMLRKEGQRRSKACLRMCYKGLKQLQHIRGQQLVAVIVFFRLLPLRMAVGQWVTGSSENPVAK